MRYISFEQDGKTLLGVRDGKQIRVLGEETLEQLLARGVDLQTYGRDTESKGTVEETGLKLLPPLRRPTKIICVGLNFADHTKESNFKQPDYPTIFLRLNTSLIAHNQPMIRPTVSDSLDFEGEIAVSIEDIDRGTGNIALAIVDGADHDGEVGIVIGVIVADQEALHLRLCRGAGRKVEGLGRG